ncbi:MAG: DUF3459 domain-containing protein [Roseiflexaceae bacterium]|nr:DUF3459 domain-containing protein [Roseiflexaceae bacterium]
MPVSRIAFALLLLLAACSTQQAASPTAPPAPAAVVAATASIPEPAAATAAPAPAPITFEQPPAWAQGSAIYQLFVRAYTPEGTFAAASARLPELRDLGVEIIYLLPIHPIGQERRKGELGSPYSIRDYRAIDPALGSEEDFRNFVNTAHDLGLKVMLDLVANHTAWDNPLISEHPDWYTRNAAGEIVPPNPEWTDVADLNYANAELRQYMIETSLYWVDQFGIDGYRCDVSDAVPLDFWQSWRVALKAANPELLLLSESGGVQMYNAAFEVAYDWTTRTEFVSGLLAPNQARRAMSNISFEAKQYGPALWRMRYLENHDHDRIATATREIGQRRAAAAFLLTLPGLPLVYAGQEVGAIERPSLFDPFTVDFAGGEQELRETYRQLLQLRRESPGLRANNFARVQAEGRTILLYERESPEQRVLVAINMDDEPAEAVFAGYTQGRDMLTDEMIDISSKISLEPFAFRIFDITSQ